MDSMLNFQDKVALITGASQGLGKLLAIELAKRGAKLVLGDIKSEALADVTETLKADGYPVISLAGDVSSSEYCQSLTSAAVENYGRLDISVNNAGVAPAFSPLHLTDEATMDKQFAVNVKGVQFGMKSQIEQMLTQGGGVILNVSSMAGLGGAPTISSYAAAKHAVVGLTKSGALEYAAANIRINAICPFFTLTNMVTDVSDDEGRKTLARRTPMKRLADPKEIVAAMLLILSPANTYMNGQCIAIDGGVSAG
ncbi:glucose 1-dehydrogenase [Thalassotalea sp. M1531]|uniref:Glucose 1-dehydrogenase n=1 Tax=Thalassotalea algicola TaxID=2716224 RepID=A0A7Y0LED4_9GAMM|nr:glucose 1-dehydrogenase [Thalassotalea algicola]NMP31615.1 glucose 1-dehydrogenase [Thalassotalea algicola]